MQASAVSGGEPGHGAGVTAASMKCTSFECTKRRQDPADGKGEGNSGMTGGDAIPSDGNSGGAVVAVAMPYVFRYLANELAGMKIKMKLTIGKGGING